MIWLTGDKHGQIEFFSKESKFKKIRKNDTLIVCGDFGFLWNKSKKELKNLKWLSKRKYTIAFVEGCFDSKKILSSYGISSWNGGKARLIEKNIVHLIKGQCYEIEGKTVLALGGGEVCKNFEFGFENFEEEENLIDQAENIVKNLELAKTFQLVVSHEAPSSVAACLDNSVFKITAINVMLEKIKSQLIFNKWFFGKYHVNRHVLPKFYAVFNDVVEFKS